MQISLTKISVKIIVSSNFNKQTQFQTINIVTIKITQMIMTNMVVQKIMEMKTSTQTISIQQESTIDN